VKTGNMIHYRAKKTKNADRRNIPPTAVTGQWVLFVRLVKQSFVNLKPGLHPCDAKISSSSLANVMFSLSESVNETPDAAIREPAMHINIGYQPVNQPINQNRFIQHC